jgi:hypothetical protein
MKLRSILSMVAGSALALSLIAAPVAFSGATLTTKTAMAQAATDKAAPAKAEKKAKKGKKGKKKAEAPKAN